jgi:hypothetical protein
MGRRSGTTSDTADLGAVAGAARSRVQQRQDDDAAVRQQHHARSSFSSNSGGGGGMDSSRWCFVNDGGVMKRRQEEQYTLERNRGARYSAVHHADNGMLRFYLTPMRSASGRRAGAAALSVTGGK